MKHCWRCVASWLVALFLLGVPPTVLGQFGPAQFNQMKANCRASGGRPSSENYNDWARPVGGGCICPPATTGSGNPTCSGSGGMTGGAPTPQLGELGGQLLIQALGLRREESAEVREAREAEREAKAVTPWLPTH